MGKARGIGGEQAIMNLCEFAFRAKNMARKTLRDRHDSDAHGGVEFASDDSWSALPLASGRSASRVRHSLALTEAEQATIGTVLKCGAERRARPRL